MFDKKTYFRCTVLIWFCVKVQNVDSALSSTFNCKNRKFVQDYFFCDGVNNCGDNSDESGPGCNSFWCNRGRFYCDGICKNITVRCNTKPDCHDGSDESNCGNELPIDDCTWQKGKYLCEDNLRCIYLNHTCNGHCNCFDCSDENPDCLSDEEMEEYTKKTSYTCFKTPNGPHCCLDSNSSCYECTENQCEQKCIEFRQEPKCSCDENYVGVPGTKNKQCVSSEAKQNTLIYSTENSIGVLDLFSNSTRTIKEKIDATALASAHNYVYYGTFSYGIGHIFKTSISSDETHEITKLNSKIISIAVDWITNNTYYATNASKIVTCSKDGKVCRQLKSCNAHSIGLAPRFGLLFWVETKDDGDSLQYIWKSGMDGSDEEFLTVCDKVSWPIAISVDELTEKLYFWTSLMELSFISFNGNNKKILQPRTQSPADRAFFTVFERKVYYSSLKSNQIYATGTTSKLFSATVLFSYTNASSINHLYAYNPRLQRTKIQNPCHEICTDGLCLLRPFKTKFILNYTCFHDRLEILSEQSNEDNTGFIYKVIIFVIIASSVIFLFKIGIQFFIRWKKIQFSNNELAETAVSLESCKNNALLLDVGECSKLKNDKNEKNMMNENCSKLDNLEEKKMINNILE